MKEHFHRGGRMGAGSDSRAHRVALGLITVLGLLVRLLYVEVKPLWYDEAYTHFVSTQPSLSSLLHTLCTADSHPPLFYLLARLMLGVFPEVELGLRIVSLFCGVCAIPLSYRLARNDSETLPALFVAALVALLPATIHFSVEARSYSLLLMLSLLVQAAYRRFVTGHGPWSLWLLTLLCVLILYTHVFGVFVVAGVHIHYFLTQRDASDVRRWSLAGWLQILLFTPWLVAVFNQVDRWQFIAGVAHYVQVDLVLLRYSPLMAVPVEVARASGLVLFASLIIGALWGKVRRRSGLPNQTAVGPAVDSAARPCWILLVTAVPMFIAGLWLTLTSAPFEPSLPLLASRYLGRSLLVSSSVQLLLATAPLIVRGLRQLRWLGAVLHRLAHLPFNDTFILFVLLAASVLSVFQPAVGYKQLIVIVPNLYIFCARRWLQGFRRKLATGVLVAYVALTLIALPFQGSYNVRADYRSAAAHVQRQQLPHLPIVLFPGHEEKILRLYLQYSRLAPLWAHGRSPIDDIGLRAGERFWFFRSTYGRTKGHGQRYLDRLIATGDLVLQVHDFTYLELYLMKSASKP